MTAAEYSFDFYMETKNIAIAYDTHPIPALGRRRDHLARTRQIHELAAAHEQARRTAVPIDPVDTTFPDMTLDDAYAIQAAWIDLQRLAGAV